jgi:hypothetical protein
MLYYIEYSSGEVSRYSNYYKAWFYGRVVPGVYKYVMCISNEGKYEFGKYYTTNMEEI